MHAVTSPAPHNFWSSATKSLRGSVKGRISWRSQIFNLLPFSPAVGNLVVIGPGFSGQCACAHSHMCNMTHVCRWSCVHVRQSTCTCEAMLSYRCKRRIAQWSYDVCLVDSEFFEWFGTRLRLRPSIP